MIYLFIIFLLLLLSYRYDISEKGSNSTFWIYVIYIIFVFVAGFRYDIGVDTHNYKDFFDGVPTLSNLTKGVFANTRFRPGIIVFYSLCKSIIPNFTFALIVEAVFINSVFFSFIRKNTSYVFTALLIYFLVNYLEFNTEIQREVMAISFGLLAWNCYEKKKWLQTICLFLVAIEFHISAFVLLLYPILYSSSVNKKWLVYGSVILIAAPVVLSSISGLQLIIESLLNTDNADMIESYTKTEYNQQLNYKAFVVYYAFYTIAFFISIYLQRNNIEHFGGFLACFYLLFFMHIISYAFYRFTNYLSPFVWIGMAEFINTLIRDLKAKGIRFSFVCLVLLSTYLLYAHQSKLKSFDPITSTYAYEQYYPYESILSGNNY